jgi:hypothetical protein
MSILAHRTFRRPDARGDEQAGFEARRERPVRASVHRGAGHLMKRPRSAVVVLAAIAATSVGCASSDRSSGRSAAGGTVVPGKSCARGTSRPVPTRALVALLRAHGIDARHDTYCASPDAVAQVSNVSLPVPDAQQRRIHRLEGDVLCLLTSKPGLRKLKRLNYGNEGALLVVLNVSCNVYPVGKTADAQIRRVVAALEQIEHRYS